MSSLSNHEASTITIKGGK